MAASLHAVALLALVGGSVALSARWGPPEAGLRWGWALLAAASTLLVLFLLTSHMCTDGNPVHQVLAGSVCAGALLLRIRSANAAGGLAVGVALASLALSYHHLGLVHSPDWTGNPTRQEGRRIERALKRGAEVLKDLGGTDLTAYPEGWLTDAEFLKKRLPDDLPHSLFRVEVRWTWHSAFTGIFRRRATPGAIWFPGGALADAASRLEWRPRAPLD